MVDLDLLPPAPCEHYQGVTVRDRIPLAILVTPDQIPWPGVFLFPDGGATMPPLPSPCMDCGHLTRNGGRCVDCARERYSRENKQRRADGSTPRSRESSTKRGYNSAWKRLSALARSKQPFCSDCGTADKLTADHSPQAWERVEAGLPLRIQDIDVVCQACNNARGAARGDTVSRTD